MINIRRISCAMKLLAELRDKVQNQTLTPTSRNQILDLSLSNKKPQCVHNISVQTPARVKQQDSLPLRKRLKLEL